EKGVAEPLCRNGDHRGVKPRRIADEIERALAAVDERALAVAVKDALGAEVEKRGHKGSLTPGFDEAKPEAPKKTGGGERKERTRPPQGRQPYPPRASLRPPAPSPWRANAKTGDPWLRRRPA